MSLLELNTTVNTSANSYLFESSSLAQWVNTVLIKGMDRFASARSLLVVTVMMYFLGHCLRSFLLLYVSISCYVLLLRLIRWWIRRRLFFLFEFCYFAMISVAVYILFFPANKVVFLVIYVTSSGILGLSILLFSNQAAFNSTDHISSAWLHFMPLVCVFAIRWREKLYPSNDLIKMNFVPTNDIIFADHSEMLCYLVVFPICFWLLWVVYYTLFFYIGCSFFITKYRTGLDDFKDLTKKLEWICGDPAKYTKVKYLLQHFVFFSAGLPPAILSFHSFAFNVFWINLLLVYLLWNASKNHSRLVHIKVQEKVREIENESNSKIK